MTWRLMNKKCRGYAMACDTREKIGDYYENSPPREWAPERQKEEE
jgi:hypothetical protein